LRLKPSGTGLAVPLGAAPVVVAVSAGKAVLRASTVLLKLRPLGVMLALMLTLQTTEEFTMVFAAEELLVRVIVVVQDVLEAAGDDTLFSPGIH
jgi:hypothetical protein